MKPQRCTKPSSHSCRSASHVASGRAERRSTQQNTLATAGVNLMPAFVRAPVYPHTSSGDSTVTCQSSHHCSCTCLSVTAAVFLQKWHRVRFCLKPPSMHSLQEALCLGRPQDKHSGVAVACASMSSSSHHLVSEAIWRGVALPFGLNHLIRINAASALQILQAQT